MNRVTVAAVDLGATSGRVILGSVGEDFVDMEVVARFPNEPLRLPSGLHWDMACVYRNTLRGLRSAVSEGATSVGIDSWGVDYGLIQGRRLVGLPFHYRDVRSQLGVELVHSLIAPEELYRENGTQHLPFNTIFQLATEKKLLEGADSVLMIADLIVFWLTGEAVMERTIASTTGLLDPVEGDWNIPLAETAGLPVDILPPLVDAGQIIGGPRPEVVEAVGGAPTVALVGAHDTASAVAAVPTTQQGFAYIVCGTWGLVGVETSAPIRSEPARLANFTNERGVDGRNRFLRNVAGLWLLNESIRQWQQEGRTISLGRLVAEAAERPSGATFSVNDPIFLAPGRMADRIQGWLANRGLPVPKDPAGLVRCILESLALEFASSVIQAGGLAGVSVEVIHLVGGGSHNPLLCQLLAAESQRPVVAGPAEATALGNMMMQAKAAGVGGSLESVRRMVAQSFDLRVFQPD